MQWSPDPATGLRRRPLEILVVEDHIGTQQAIGDALLAHRCLGRLVETICDADAAIRDLVPDVIVCGLEPDVALHAFGERLQNDARTVHVGRITLARELHSVDTQAAFGVALRKRPLQVTTLFGLIERLAISGRFLRRGPAP